MEMRNFSIRSLNQVLFCGETPLISYPFSIYKEIPLR